MNKKIHIGQKIRERADFLQIPSERLAERLSIPVSALNEVFSKETIDTGLLLKISKRLNYDFFRLYTGHLIVYAPSSATSKIKEPRQKMNVAFDFRKNVYTPEIIAYFIRKLEKQEISIGEIISKYKIPKSTIYRWKTKYML